MLTNIMFYGKIPLSFWFDYKMTLLYTDARQTLDLYQMVSTCISINGIPSLFLLNNK